MKKITDLVGPATILGIYISLILQLYLFFKPTLSEFGIFFAVDIAMAIASSQLINAIFTRLFPNSRSFFPKLSPDIHNFSISEKQTIYRAMLEYPRQIALFIIPVNILKVIPASLVILFYWQHGMPLWVALAYILTILFFNFSYMSGMAYLENHNFLSKLVSNLHKESDWSEVFANVSTKELQISKFLPNESFKTKCIKLSSEFATVENYSICSIWFFASALLISLNHSSLSHWMDCIYIAFFACFFTLRLGHYSRKELLLGLESLIEFYDPNKDTLRKYLPLHTSPHVQFFQKNFNALLHENNIKEREISTWILERSEKKRFSDLGEIAGLVIHDLLNPIHNIKYSLAAIEENIQETQCKYTEQIRGSLQHIEDLLSNLKDNIRSPKLSPNPSSVNVALNSVKKTIKYYFHPGETHDIDLSILPLQDDPQVLIPQPELNQILINLVSNSFKNLMTHKVSQPKVEISFHQNHENLSFIRVRDNGSGMSFEDFEFFTENQERKDNARTNPKSGLGLRLTKRLVENYGGNLLVLQAGPNRPGTTFHLELKTSRSKS